MKRCVQCGKEYEDDKVYCPECGVRLDEMRGSPKQVSVLEEDSSSEEGAAASETKVPLYRKYWETIGSIVGIMIMVGLRDLDESVFPGVVVEIFCGIFAWVDEKSGTENKMMTTAILLLALFSFLTSFV